MIKTGISKLDEMLGGGIKRGANIMLIGPPMSGKKIISNYIMYYGAARNENAVIEVNTYEPGYLILERLKENKLNLTLSKVGIVDCLTRMIGIDTYEDESIKIASSSVDLTDIGVKISQHFENFFTKKNIRKIQLNINSLSTLLMYSNIRTVFRFLQVFTGRIKAAGGLGIYVIESGVHDIQVITALSQLFDGKIEIKSEKDKNFLRIVGLLPKPTQWLEYEINNANVRILGRTA